MNFEEFKKEYEKKPVNLFPDKVNNNPIVSVCVITFQHVNYIKQCLEGILMQKTNFPIEILLGDDDSTDGTREICIEYAERYADKIRLFLHHRENNIKIDGRATGRFNFLYNLYSAKGKYIAMCEGDDYWIDPFKLQKQVEFMELNPEFNFSMGKVKKLFQSKNKLINQKKFHVSPNKKEEFSLKDYLFNSFSQTATFLFRNNLKNFNFPNWFLKSPVGDIPLVVLITGEGKIKYHNEYFSVYRVHSAGATFNINPEVFYKNASGYLEDINKHLEFKYNKIIKFRIELLRIKSFALKTNNKIAIRVFYLLCNILTMVFYKIYRNAR